MTGPERPQGAWRPVLVDVGSPLVSLATGGHERLHVTAVRADEVLGCFLLDAPVDPVPVVVLRDALLQHLERRLARPVEDVVPRTIAHGGLPGTTAVMVCTRDRPDDLERCLTSVAALQGGVDEVVVVDNGSRGPRTREVAEAAGVTYVQEPRPGLDRARNRGLLTTTAELLLCTDDDVEVDAEWALRLRACFDDPLVMAATGLVLPARLDTESRRRFEAYAGFSRGVRLKVLDGTRVPATWAGTMGAGASMSFRTSFLRSVAGFPEELDAGMPTESGGDTYALYRVLREGYRLVYEPRALAHHHHRREPEQLARAVSGYGTGAMSYLAHAVVHDRDVHAAVAAVSWFVERAGRDPLRSLLRRPGAVPLGLLAQEVRGMLRTGRAYPAARRAVAGRPPVITGRQPLPPVPLHEPVLQRPPAVVREVPRLSVVVPSRARRDVVTRLVRSLDAQDYPEDRLEVLVVLDGDVDGSRTALEALDVRHRPRVLATSPPTPARGLGAAVARNTGAAAATGDVVLFFDDDVEPVAPTTLMAHASAHAGAGRPLAVVGACPPKHWDVQGRHARAVRNWWVDHVSSKPVGRQLGFADVLTGNLSCSRAAFEQAGGFQPLPRREDWELGHRLLSAGVRVETAPGTAVWHDADLDLSSALHDRVAEGHGDAVFAGRAPGVAGLLPLAGWLHLRPRGRAARALLFAGATKPLVSPALSVTAQCLHALEAAQLDHRWERLNTRAVEAAYLAGVAQVLSAADLVALLDEGPEQAVMEVDLALEDDEQVLVPPLRDGVVAVLWHGTPIGKARASLGGCPWRQEVMLDRLRVTFGARADAARLRGRAA